MPKLRTRSTSKAGITERLADCIASVQYDTLPEDVINMAKVVALDGLANMLAGSNQPLGKILIKYISSMGGKPTATIIGSGLRTSPPFAAFANAAFCHSMDYEAMWWPPTHPTSPVLPAIFALSEHKGSTGRKVIEALVVGFEVQGRLNRITEWFKNPYTCFHPPGTIGVIGSAAACSKLLCFDTWQTRMALGIAASRTGGLWANTGTMTKSQHSANSARSGVESALLAWAGYTSNENIIEDKKGGFGQLIFGENADLEIAVKNFGRPYLMVDPGIYIKKYPAQTTTHWGIETTLEIRNKHNLNPADIRQVVITVGHPNWSAHRPKPETGLEGKFSIHYTAALALLDGKLSIDSFTDERRFSPDIEKMLGKIVVVEDKEIPEGLNFAQTWGETKITLNDGRVFQAKCDRPRGRWDNPLNREERLLKFHDCAQKILSKKKAIRVIELIDGLEQLRNISELTAIVGQKPHKGAQKRT